MFFHTGGSSVGWDYMNRSKNKSASKHPFIFLFQVCSIRIAVWGHFKHRRPWCAHLGRRSGFIIFSNDLRLFKVGWHKPTHSGQESETTSYIKGATLLVASWVRRRSVCPHSPLSGEAGRPENKSPQILTRVTWAVSSCQLNPRWFLWGGSVRGCLSERRLERENRQKKEQDRV